MYLPRISGIFFWTIRCSSGVKAAGVISPSLDTKLRAGTILTKRPGQISLDSVNYIFRWTAEMRILDLHVLEESVNNGRVLGKVEADIIN